MTTLLYSFIQTFNVAHSYNPFLSFEAIHFNLHVLYHTRKSFVGLHRVEYCDCTNVAL